MTQFNLMQEIEEEVQRKRMAALWERYGNYVLAFAILLVAATSAYVTWDRYRAKVEQRATAELMQVVSTKGEERTTALEKFAEKTGNESQAVFARLYEASLFVEKGEADKAVAIYDKIASDGSVEKIFRQLADLLAVQSQIDKGDVAALQKRLLPLVEPDVAWHHSAEELSAFLSLRAGDKGRAIQLFSALAQDKEAPQTLAARAADMLKFLAVEQ